MPYRIPKTKAGKRKVAAEEMREFSRGKLRSGSGHKVTNPAQAKAIAMKVSGQSRYGRRSKQSHRRQRRR